MAELENESRDPEDEFAVPIGVGMTLMPEGAGVKFDEGSAREIRELLDRFDEMRTSAYVESRSVHLGRGRTN